MAWLQKGGLYNRLARYDEAMGCYEKALEAQKTLRENIQRSTFNFQ